MPDNKTTGISTAAHEAWDAWDRAKEHLKLMDKMRDRAAAAERSAQKELVRLGRLEGWHV